MTELGTAYLEGFQQKVLGPDSVACTSKHFPGGGPQKDGEDAHFPYGREQVYPGGRFAEHLEPFPAVIEAGTAAVMPYYGMPVGLEVDGVAIEEVGFGYNAQVVTGMLREQLGYDGVVLTDWELVNDNHVGDQVLPARAWGVEHLDPHQRMERIIAAGADQFGGEECVDVLLDLVAQGRVTRVPDRRVRPPAAGREVPSRAVRRPVRRRRRGVAHRGSRRLPGRRPRGTGPLGHRAHQRQHGCRPGPSPGERAAHLRREREPGRGGAARHPRGPARGRGRRARAAHGALRTALGPVPRVVVPPGLARLPPGADRAAAADRGRVPPRRRRRARPAGGADAGAAGGRRGGRQLRHQRRRPARGAHRGRSRHGGGCRSTCRARWTRSGPTPRTFPATTTRSSRSATG